LYPWYDAHGNQAVGNHSTMGVEIYGNKIIHNYPTSAVRVVDIRGGKGAIFNNYVQTPGGINATVREEYADSMTLPATGPAGQSQHVSDTYFWNNRKNGVNLAQATITQDTSNGPGTPNNPPVLEEDREFWNQNESFDGTTGMGCGIPSDMPATCTEGVAYWATWQTCSTLSENNVGASPTVPIDGTLYKCTSTDTWTPYFSPYPYPHPLRME